MTKVSKKTKSADMRSHIEESFDFINKHLPVRYVARTLEILKEMNISNISAGTIRNVRMNGAARCENLQVLTALLKVAKENEQIVNNFSETLSEIKNS